MNLRIKKIRKKITSQYKNNLLIESKLLMKTHLNIIHDKIDLCKILRKGNSIIIWKLSNR